MEAWRIRSTCILFDTIFDDLISAGHCDIICHSLLFCNYTIHRMSKHWSHDQPIHIKLLDLRDTSVNMIGVRAAFPPCHELMLSASALEDGEDDTLSQDQFYGLVADEFNFFDSYLVVEQVRPSYNLLPYCDLYMKPSYAKSLTHRELCRVTAPLFDQCGYYAASAMKLVHKALGTFFGSTNFLEHMIDNVNRVKAKYFKKYGLQRYRRIICGDINLRWDLVHNWSTSDDFRTSPVLKLELEFEWACIPRAAECSGTVRLLVL